MNGVLIFVAIVFAVAAIVGYVKGLIKMIASLLATLVIIVLVIFFAPHMSKAIKNITPIEDKVKEKITSVIMSETTDESDSKVQEELTRDQQTAYIENAQLPDMLKKKLLENNQVEAYAALGVNTFVDYIAAYITKIITDAIATLIVLLLALILVPILVKVLDLVNKLPVIGGMNRLAGGVVGLGIGLAIVWVFFVVVTLAYNTKFGGDCLASIEANAFLQKLYDGNILMNMIMKF
jgi:uncharacterized membrane protein required for colicin V production